MKYYLIIINIIAFILFAIDKYKSIKKSYRISEKTFFIISLLGGFLGLIISGQLFRHKTKKMIFNVIYVISIIIWSIILYYYVKEYNFF